MQTKWTHILHIADIHIRNFTRHKEYREAFSKLYTAVADTPESTLVYIGGDIVHSKIDISPELIELTSEFLFNLAELRTTVLIMGNHDANLNNESRLDTLSPIINNINHDNLYYLDEAKNYTFGNIDFSVFEIATDKKDWPKAGTNDINIALHHGAVYNSKTDVGYTISSDSVKTSDFDGFDLALLGDIHKLQFVDDDKRVYYPGSLIQQNFGESYKNHGYTIWDLSTLEPHFFEIENPYAYYTVYVESGQIGDISNIPANPRIKIFHTGTTEAELKSVAASLRSVCTPVDIVQVKRDVLTHEIENKTTTKAINTRDVEYQNTLIKSYLDRVHSSDAETVDKVLQINETLNKSVVIPETIRHVIWTPLSFEFSNMFSYGENNRLDFNSMSGLIGLFAKNHTGKSALLDSLTYCIFDKCSRTTRADSVMNNERDTFSCVFEFEANEQLFYIERKAKRKPSGRVKSDVTFWTIDDSGEKIILNGEQRSETNTIIRRYLGSYEDFVLTALSSQNDSTGFIDKGQTERKDLLSQFLDITVFEQLHDLASEEVSDIKALLKDFKRTDYSSLLNSAKTKLIESENSVKRIDLSAHEYKGTKLAIAETVSSMSANLRDIEHIDVQTEYDNIKYYTTEINKFKQAITSLQSKEVEHNDTLSKCDTFLSTVNIDNVNSDIELIGKYTKDKHAMVSTVSKLKTETVQLKKSIAHLETHEYDPDCTYCCNNEFVKAATQAKQDLPGLEDSLAIATDRLALYDENINKLSSAPRTKEMYNKVLLKQSGVKVLLQRLTIQVQTLQGELSHSLDQVQIANNNIAKYEKSKDDIEYNTECQSKIDKLQDELVAVDNSLSLKTEQKIEAVSETKRCQYDIDNILGTMSRAHALEFEMNAYDLYMTAIKRDGIPYEIISDSLPVLESEVNDILSQIVDFTLYFKTDGKNIHTLIKYADEPWDLSLASGMEKFISSLAIRIGLIQISSLPRPNFIAIDEGFGNLDSDNMQCISTMFEYMKNLFDFIIIISHIDIMKDMPDQLITIDVKDGFSYISS
jgi:DNA repair exonuclease SbcCD ATPase subunit